MLLGLARAALFAALAAAAAEPEPGAGAALAAATAAPAAAGAHDALRLAEGDRHELEVGTSTLLELIDGPRAGSRYRCIVTGRGELPDTYNVKALFSPPQELENVPAELLQRPSEASSFILRPKPIPAVVGSEDRGASEQEEEGQNSEEGEPEEEASGDPAGEPGAQSYLGLKGSRAKLKEGPGEAEAEGAPAEEEEEDAAPKEASKEAMEEKQRQELEAIQRMLGHTPAPLPAQSPVDNPSHAIKELRHHMVDDRHRRAAAAAQRKEESKHRMQALTSEHKKLLSNDMARQAALRAQRKAYWQTSKEKLHITVRDWNGTQVEFSVRAGLGLRALMVTAVQRLGLQRTEVEFLKNGTRMTPFQTLASAGLRDRDVLDVEPKDPRLRQATAAALARRPVERRPAQAPAPAQAQAQAPAAGHVKAAPLSARRSAAQAFEPEVYKKKQPKWGGGAKNPDVEYEVGDFMEMKIEHTVRRLNSGPDQGGLGQGGNWIPCTITGKGSKPNTYKVHFPLAPSQQGDIEDVPSIGLRMVQAQDWAQKIKRLRQDPAAAQEAMAQAAREAEKRRRLKALTNKVKGSVATPQTAEQAAQKPLATKPPVPTAVRRPMAPGAQHGILPASALGEKRPALSRH